MAQIPLLNHLHKGKVPGFLLESQQLQNGLSEKAAVFLLRLPSVPEVSFFQARFLVGLSNNSWRHSFKAKALL